MALGSCMHAPCGMLFSLFGTAYVDNADASSRTLVAREAIGRAGHQQVVESTRPVMA